MTDIKTRSGLLSHTDTQLANGSGSITPAKHRDLVKSLINSMATLDEVTLRVTNMSTTTPPGSPSDRDKYVVGSGATGDWSGQDDNIAIYDANASPAGWYFISVTDGLGVWNLADDTEYRWDAGASPAAWTAQSGGGGGGTVAVEEENASVVASASILNFIGGVDVTAPGGGQADIAPFRGMTIVAAGQADLSDDAVKSFTLTDSSSGFFAYVHALAFDGAIFGGRVLTASPTITKLTTGTNYNTSTSVLTGTTGTDGKITVSANGGKIYVENRSAAARKMNYIIFEFDSAP